MQFPSNLHFASCEPLIGSVRGIAAYMRNSSQCFDGSQKKFMKWLIAGGETGQHPRPTHPQWIRELRDICRANSARFFFKQWGALVPEFQWKKDAPKNAEWREKFSDGEVAYNGVSVELFRFKQDEGGALLDGVGYRDIPIQLEEYAPRAKQKELFNGESE